MSEKKDLTSIFETKSVETESTESAPSILDAPHLSESGSDSAIFDSPSDAIVFENPDRFELNDESKANDEKLPLETAPSIASVDSIAPIKAFAESIPLGSAQAAPAYPFHLSIEGELDVHDRTRLVDLINRHDMGIREVDLEPQFESNRVLIPRISEYAVVLIAQALRSSRATIYATPSDRAHESPSISPSPKVEVRSHDNLTDSHPADSIPVTQDHRIAGARTDKIVDVLMTGASLKATSLDPEHSIEYNELLDALKTELKYRAFRKGANGIVNFKVSISYSEAVQMHKIVVTGTAIKTSPQSH